MSELISFQEQIKGYKKDEVDSYIRKVSDAYELMRDDFRALQEKHNELKDKYWETTLENDSNKSLIRQLRMENEKLKEEVIRHQNSGGREQGQKGDLTKSILEAEEIRRQIIQEAEMSAQSIRDDAREEIQRMMNKKNQIGAALKNLKNALNSMDLSLPGEGRWEKAAFYSKA